MRQINSTLGCIGNIFTYYRRIIYTVNLPVQEESNHNDAVKYTTGTMHLQLTDSFMKKGSDKENK